MRNITKIFTAGCVIAGSVIAQDSVEAVMKDLQNAKSTTPAPVAVESAVAPASVELATTPKPAASASKGWKFWSKKKVDAPALAATSAEPATAEAPAAAAEKTSALDVPATLEKSRDLYTAGEFEQAQRGFEAVVKKEPENIVARMYLRKIVERDHRITEVQGMKAVRAGWNTDIVMRSYDISAQSATKMGLEQVKELTDVGSKFPDVCFPKGSSAFYQPKTGKLVVRNTVENLQVLEELLSAMDVTKVSSGEEQVEIEAKFLEVAEGTLEQLGFEWNFQNSVRTGIEGGDVIADDGAGLFANSLRGSSQSPNLPFSQSSGYSSAGQGMDGFKTFRFEDTFNKTSPEMKLHNAGSKPLDVLISALDQTSGTDMLAAPRIVTKNGEKATIRVGQVHYLPEAYDVGGDASTVAHVKYQDFTEKLMGVELEVNPKIDGDQIALALNPKVTELLGWQSFQIAPANSSYGSYQYAPSTVFLHDALEAKMPILKRREVKTSVIVADGGTIGMGGLISDKIEKYEDKVPVLGSLPLIGRLFRNEGERAVKQNLLIFVTAKKVEPNGRINTARSFE